MNAIKVHSFQLSGHSHRVRLGLSLMGIPFEVVEVDLRKGAHKQPEFLALNPFGQVPVIEDDGVAISDSNAILVYAARKYGNESWLPTDALGQSEVQKWLSIAAGPLLNGPASARLVTLFGAKLNAADLIARSHALLKVMEATLSRRDFLALNRPTIADIANYTYVAHAPEGNVSLDEYPNICAWLLRIEQLPGFIPFTRSLVGLQAIA